MTRYFTFGQNHAHARRGVTYDRDCVVMISSDDPRKVMVEEFGQKWSMEYEECPDMRLFPRGIIEILDV